MKRFITLLLCVLLLGSVSAAYAAGGSALQLLGYHQNEANLDIILYAKGSSILTSENFSARFDDTKLPVSKIGTLADTEYGTSWIVIVEPAPSSNITELAPSLVESLVSHLGKNDNLAVLNAKTGELSSFVHDMPTIRAFVKDAAAQDFTGGYVKLYDAVNTAFSEFSTNTELNPRKCLVIISGCEDRNSRCSFKELLRQAEDSPVTVYTVGITRGIANNINAFEDLRALSDMGASGLAIALADFPSSAGTDTALTLLDNEKKCAVLSVDLSELSNSMATDSMKGTLRVSLDANDASLAQVEIKKPTPREHVHEWDDNATCQTKRTCKICGMEDPNGELAKCKDDGTGHCVWCKRLIEPSPIGRIINWLKQHIIIAAMGGVLCILLIVLIVVLISRKRGGNDGGENRRSKTGPVIIDDEEGITEPVRDVMIVELTRKTTGERFTGEIVDSRLKAGLECPLRLSGDPAISRRHMEFIWQHGILYVQDIGSKNGTYVDGERITGAVRLNQNAMIHAGESDFLVTWRSKGEKETRY